MEEMAFFSGLIEHEQKISRRIMFNAVRLRRTGRKCLCGR